MSSPRLCGTGCGRPAHQDLEICVHCTWTLERDLDAAPDLAAELDITRYRLSAVTSSSEITSASVHEPLPFDPRAADVALALHEVLDAWAARLERAVTGRARPQHTAGVARWLLHHHSELAARADAAAAVTEVHSAVALGWRAVDRPADRVYVGACGCGKQLYARPGRPTVTCPGCAREHDTAARRADIQAELDGRLMTGAEIARLAQYFGHPVERERARNLIKTWAGRGIVVAHGHSDAGDPLYPFGDTLTRLLSAAAARPVATAERSVLPSVAGRTVPGAH